MRLSYYASFLAVANRLSYCRLAGANHASELKAFWLLGPKAGRSANDLRYDT